MVKISENEVIEGYGLSPERIRWLVTLLEDKLERGAASFFTENRDAGPGAKPSVTKLNNNIL